MSRIIINRARNSEAGNILIVLVVVILVGVVLLFVMKPVEKVVLTPREEAEDALNAYCNAAWNYVKIKGTTRGNDLKATVYPPDWQWYEDNYDDLFEDTFRLSGSVSATTEKNTKMATVMRNILSTGVHRPDCEILGAKEVNNSLFIFRLKQLMDTQGGTPTYEEFDVKVTRQGKKWFVQEFGGAMPIIREAGTAGGLALPGGFSGLQGN